MTTEVFDSVEDAVALAEPSGWLVTGDVLLEEPAPPPLPVAAIVPDTGTGLLTADRDVLLHGPGGIGKTMFAEGGCIEVTLTGHSAVFLDWESNYRNWHRRIAKLRAGPRERGLMTDPDIRHHLFYGSMREPFDPRRVLPPDTRLVVIDSSAMAHEAEDLDEHLDWGKFVTRILKPIREQVGDQACILVIDHPGNATSERARGSSKKRAWFDIELSLERPGNGRIINVVVRKDRDDDLGVPAGSTVAKFDIDRNDDGTVSVRLTAPLPGHDADGNFRPTYQMEKVSNYVSMQVDPVSMRSVRDNVRGKRVSIIDDAVRILVTDGYLSEESGPKRGRYFRSLRPYVAEQDPKASRNGRFSATVAQDDDGSRGRP